ncbi:MAG: VOC family protein [Thermoproteota archaeon]|nr:VOC family protein [Thermoproteota archaeon]
MTFTKIGAVILLVSDMETSIRFYRDVLNLPIKSQSKDWTEFFNRETVLALHPARKAQQQSSSQGKILVGFMVSDLEAQVELLKKKNIKFFKRLKDEPFGKHAIIEDPDGHLISLAEIKSKGDEGFDLIGFFGAE